ncbi:MAG: hypothetical protein NWS48_13755, partial [Akkermansiaceae bacterium]|nr:hypothetical protein [Akkermansiaceae bacterium]
MKTIIFTALATVATLGLISCDKPDDGLSEKLERLERNAANAQERQREIEAELADRKLADEMDAIERERTLIEEERLRMEDERYAKDSAAAAELENRQRELAEREERIAREKQELESKEQELTGLEGVLNERELELAGREPIGSFEPRRDYVSGAPTGDFDNFYEPLANYGSWFNTSDYGYVYQPTVVNDSSWRPYTRGRWAFTDQGWTWVSDEPFGWACYHYGRWVPLQNYGWVWVPGSEWAPAWVTWRESPGYVGWAPLPPETLAWQGRSWDSTVEVTFGIGSSWFSFVSYENFGGNIRPYCQPAARNPVIYRDTRCVTRYQVNDRRVFVGGPQYQEVCRKIGREFPVHRLRVDDSPDFRRRNSELSPRFSGDELRVVAPRMEAGWNGALRPDRVRRDLGDVSADRPRELDESVRDRFRDRRNAEQRDAERMVEDSGGRERFERERRQQLEEARQEAEREQVLQSEREEAERQRLDLEQEEARRNGEEQKTRREQEQRINEELARKNKERERGEREEQVNRQQEKGRKGEEDKGGKDRDMNQNREEEQPRAEEEKSAVEKAKQEEEALRQQEEM